MTKLLAFLTLLCLTSCTITMINSSVKGAAQDVIDATPTNSPEVDPTLNFPAVG